MKYPLSIRVLHWFMGVTMIALIFVGAYMHDLPVDAPNKLTMYPWHKSFGILIMLLFFVRLYIRRKSTLPALPKGIKSWEAKLSHFIHIALYTSMIAMPITGYLMSSTYKYSHGIDFFGLTLPDALPKSDELFELFHTLHDKMGVLILILVALHIAGALKHRFLESKENDVLNRII
ncbi:cytochrome b [Vibrio sp. SNU_ST1]|uniref:cytochrome b n=1 Tax=Vibrio sp. SNU_ST1 TaxID=3064001 RepID=UPI00272D625D|nr:cytochrome b [Vibrio sp. SNU_ST1]WKY57271.1 cytochrome b [Vibrio sp. SNU_ST1]